MSDNERSGSNEDANERAYPEFTGTVESPSLNAEVSIRVAEDRLHIESAFDDLVVMYADIEAFVFQNHTVRLTVNEDRIVLSKMGREGEWLFQALEEAYNAKVTDALHVRGRHLAQASGSFRYGDSAGQGRFCLFEDCLMILPPNRMARRLPFLFMRALKREDHTLIITMDDGQEYQLAQMGSDLDVLERGINAGVRSCHAMNVRHIEQLDPTLSAALSARAARDWPEGVAVPYSKIEKNYPSLVRSIEKKVRASRMGETLPVLQKTCDGSRLSLGCKGLTESEAEALKAAIQGDSSEEEPSELSPEQEDALRWIFWLAIPSKEGQRVVVEFAFPGEPAATYVFRTARDFDSFLAVLNRALEAGQLQRENILLPSDKLSQDRYADERILIDRTPELQEIRKALAGRAIHRSGEGWKNSVLKLLEM